jgi:outer membrane protein
MVRISTLACLLALSFASQAISLSEALQRARASDPDVAQLDAVFRASMEDAEQSLATRRYRVNAFADASYQRSRVSSDFFGNLTESYGSFSLGVEARQPIYRKDWGEREDQARALRDQARWQRDGQVQAYLLNLAQRYFRVLEERENLELARSEVATVARSLADTQQRFDAGVLAATDLREAEARDDLARARQLAVQQSYQDALAALSERVGPVTQMPTLRAGMALASEDKRTLAAWQARAMAASPEVQRTQASVEVARAAVASANAEDALELDAFARVAHRDSSASQIGQKASEGLIGIELTWPLHNGGGAQSRQRQSVAQLNAAELALDALRRQLQRRVAEAWRARDVAARQVQAFQAVVRSAAAAEQAVRNGFDAGTRTMLEVLDASRASVEARSDLTSARYQLLLSQLSLERLSGELDAERFAQIDRWLVPGE